MDFYFAMLMNGGVYWFLWKGMGEDDEPEYSVEFLETVKVLGMELDRPEALGYCGWLPKGAEYLGVVESMERYEMEMESAFEKGGVEDLKRFVEGMSEEEIYRIFRGNRLEN